MTVTKKQLIKFNNALHDSAGMPGVKFAYANSKNRKILKSEMESLLESKKTSEDYVKYETELRSLVEKHAEKDEDGNPVQVKNKSGEFALSVPDSDKVFKKDFKALEKKHKKALDQQIQKTADYKEILEEEVDLDDLGIYRISPDQLPPQINSIQIDDLDLMIE